MNKINSYLMPFMDADQGGSLGGEYQPAPDASQQEGTIISRAVDQDQTVTDPTQQQNENSKPPIDMSNPFAAATAGMHDDREEPVAQQPDVSTVEYEKFTIPDDLGIDLAYDEKAFGEFATVASKLKLSQEQAQEIVDLYARRQAAYAQEEQNKFDQMLLAWKEKIEKHREFGGANLEKSISAVGRFMKIFGSPELVKVLNETGLGNNPDVFAAFVKAGRAISEDSRPHTANSLNVRDTSYMGRAQRLYPGMKQ